MKDLSDYYIDCLDEIDCVRSCVKNEFLAGLDWEISIPREVHADCYGVVFVYATEDNKVIVTASKYGYRTPVGDFTLEVEAVEIEDPVKEGWEIPSFVRTIVGFMRFYYPGTHRQPIGHFLRSIIQKHLVYFHTAPDRADELLIVDETGKNKLHIKLTT